jgi:hypothetical protein
LPGVPWSCRLPWRGAEGDSARGTATKTVNGSWGQHMPALHPWRLHTDLICPLRLHLHLPIPPGFLKSHQEPLLAPGLEPATPSPNSHEALCPPIRMDGHCLLFKAPSQKNQGLAQSPAGACHILQTHHLSQPSTSGTLISPFYRWGPWSPITQQQSLTLRNALSIPPDRLGNSVEATGNGLPMFK